MRERTGTSRGSGNYRGGPRGRFQDSRREQIHHRLRANQAMKQAMEQKEPEREVKDISCKSLCACFCFIVVLLCAVVTLFVVYMPKNDALHWRMTKEDNYYEILGLEAGATAAQIRKAYKTLAKEWHPDTHPKCKECPEKFRRIADAYERLTGQGDGPNLGPTEGRWAAA
eukprot:gnl/Trimastix_PCT/4565.p1 GENE.gnl/Trimastix_PCT/4565~~gnl/Trimastix_PCT/4565.p1  ORF type:complete len:170 (-),score=9.64 gnl/Trimastix_PCT/4565:46-555(-)